MTKAAPAHEGRERFAIDRGILPVRFLLGTFGATSRNSYVDVGPETMTVRMGLFHWTFPRDAVGPAASRSWSILRGLGWRSDFRGTIGLVGRPTGVVEIPVPAFRSWLTLRLDRTRMIAVSMRDPAGLIAALAPRQTD